MARHLCRRDPDRIGVAAVAMVCLVAWEGSRDGRYSPFDSVSVSWPSRTCVNKVCVTPYILTSIDDV